MRHCPGRGPNHKIIRCMHCLHFTCQFLSPWDLQPAGTCISPQTAIEHFAAMSTTVKPLCTYSGMSAHFSASVPYNQAFVHNNPAFVPNNPPLCTTVQPSCTQLWPWCPHKIAISISVTIFILVMYVPSKFFRRLAFLLSWGQRGPSSIPLLTKLWMMKVRQTYQQFNVQI